MQDVIDGIADKMIRRHPHIFGDIEASDAAAVMVNWEAIKRREKPERSSAIDGLPPELPGLMAAAKLQQRAASVGFEWPVIDDAWAKCREEVEELKEAVKNGEKAHIEEEMGDLLFACVNLARLLDVPAEIAAVQWICYGSNVFNAFVPFYANVNATPEYLANTTGRVSTGNFYWSSRLIGALADAQYAKTAIHIERYQNAVLSMGHYEIGRVDAEIEEAISGNGFRCEMTEEANAVIAEKLKALTGEALGNVLFEVSCNMKNAFASSDA